MILRKMGQRLLVAVSLVLSTTSDSNAQSTVNPEDFKGAGYHFDYSECYPPKRRRDDLFCVPNEYRYMVAGNMLRVSHNYNHSDPARATKNTQYVNLEKLDIYNGTLRKDERGYTDSSGEKREIWWLTIYTNGHTTDVFSKTEGGLLPGSGSSYILSIPFPAEKVAKDARSALYEHYLIARGLKTAKPAGEATPIPTSTENK